MEYLVWVGPRDTDWKYDASFSDAICYYSENNITSKRKANIYGDIFNSFVEDRMKQILEKHPNAKFMFYNQKIIYFIDKSLRKYAVCVNEKILLDLLDDKVYMRYWAGNYVPVLPSLLTDSKSLSFEQLHEKLDKGNEFIVQRNHSSGGFGTFYLTNQNLMLQNLKENYNELYIVSPYIKNNVPINITAIIMKEDLIIFPPSLQIVSLTENRLIYQGADFFATQYFSDELLKKIRRYSQNILKRIQRLGYLGIIGIDFIVNCGEVYFQEINPRYQASSFLINAALTDYRLTNLSMLNIAAFSQNMEYFVNEEKFQVRYSFYKEIYFQKSRHLYYLWNIAAKNPYVKDLFSDGWNTAMQMENCAYCYTIVFETNITSLNLDGGFNLYSNISGEETFLQKYQNLGIGLKISLINQGCNLTNSAKQYLQANGKIKQAVFSAIDFYLNNGMPVNVPLNLKFSDFSPYRIDLSGDRTPCLYYYDQFISEIKIEMQPEWNEKLTQNGVPYKKIAYLSTDRLRIKHESLCIFKAQEKGCYFCNIPKTQSATVFTAKDISEVIHELFKKQTFRHILIGGASASAEEEAQQIITIVQLIRYESAHIPIYIMCLPPSNKAVLKEYKDVGVNEVAYNIEIWDRQTAKKIMPGKGAIPLEHYLEILKESTKLWGTSGNVRSALIVGLNSAETLYQAIKTLCANGIQPMLSIFRPMENTKLYPIVPPSNTELLDIYHQAQKICAKYNLELGPSCDACKNNMLA